MKKINLLIAGLLSLSLNAYAARGGGSADTGGGNAVGGQLLDLFENEGTTPINVTELKAYQQVLKPLFARIEAKIPEFTTYILGNAQDKTWLMDKKALSKSCINESMIDVARVPVACQTELQVRIYEPWYKKADLQNQAALLLHELIRNKALQKNLSDESVNYITRIIFAGDNYTSRELQTQIAKSGYGALGTDADVSELQAYFSVQLKQLCDGKIRPTNSFTSANIFLLRLSADASDRLWAGPRWDAMKVMYNRYYPLIFSRDYSISSEEREKKTMKGICADIPKVDSLIFEAMKQVNARQAQ